MKENRQFSKKKRKIRQQVQVEQTYFKQILKNIENIQTTILKKLQKHTQTPPKISFTSTTKKSRKTNSSNKKMGSNTYRSERLVTATNQTESPITKKQKIMDFTDYRNYQTTKMKAQSINTRNKPLQTFPITSVFQLHPTHSNPYSRAIKTIRFSSLNQRQTQSKQNSRYLQFSQTHRGPQKSLKNRNITQQIYSYRYDQPKTHRNPQDVTGNIEEYYKKQIQKLQFQNKIFSLQQQLERCIFQKKQADFCQSQFIKAKMKKISLQIKQLKSIAENEP